MPDPGTADVMFRDLRRKLVERIEVADVVFGCVAWVTDREVLRALAGRRGVGLVVQAEDSLRPEPDDPDPDRYALRTLELYRSLPSYHPSGGAVRVFGAPSAPQVARVHHKFAVFAREVDGLAVPYGAWLGSFNWTRTASRSLESAVYFEEPSAVEACYREYLAVRALSTAL